MSFTTSRNDRRGVGNRDADEEGSDLRDFSPIGSRDVRLGVGRDIFRCKKDRTPPSGPGNLTSRFRVRRAQVLEVEYGVTLVG